MQYPLDNSQVNVRQQLINKIRSLLNAKDQHQLYAIIDAAVDDNLFGWLQLEPPESQVVCIYDGDASVRYARYAPYLMRIHSNSPLFWQWTECGWQHSWGILCTSSEQLNQIKKHFKRFLTMVHKGHTAYLRFYDPRVLQTLLPSLTPGHCNEFFGGDLIHTFGASKGTNQLWYAEKDPIGWAHRMAGSAGLISKVINLP